MGEVRPLSRQGRMEIVWARSKGSLTSEVGWVGVMKLFRIVDRGCEMALHTALPDPEGVPVRSAERVYVYPQERAGARKELHTLAEQWLTTFLGSLASPLPDEAVRLRGAEMKRPGEWD